MELLSLLAVFGLGAIELWAAVPAGLALRLHPVVIGCTAAFGAVLGILAMGLLGERARGWLVRGRDVEDDRRWYGRTRELWLRYGVVGLGLAAPLLVGAPLGTALGLTLGAPTGRLLFWMSLGAVLCTIVLTVAGTLGLIGVQALRG